MTRLVPALNTAEKECVDCERVLPINEFKANGIHSHYKRCKTCHGLRVRAGNPNHATSADSHRVGWMEEIERVENRKKKLR